MHKLLIIASLFLAGIIRVSAQETTGHSGMVQLIQDEKISLMADQYKKMNLRNQAVDGYRVQIFFDSGSNSRKRAQDALEEFIGKYPNTRVFLSFKAPYYRVRAGNFRTLAEAVGFQKKIAADYPNAFPVKEKINFRELE